MGYPPSKDKVTNAEINMGQEEEEKRNDKNYKQYLEVVETLVKLIEGGTL